MKELFFLERKRTFFKALKLLELKEKERKKEKTGSSFDAMTEVTLAFPR